MPAWEQQRPRAIDPLRGQHGVWGGGEEEKVRLTVDDILLSSSSAEAGMGLEYGGEATRCVDDGRGGICICDGIQTAKMLFSIWYRLASVQRIGGGRNDMCCTSRTRLCTLFNYRVPLRIDSGLVRTGSLPIARMLSKYCYTIDGF